MSQVERMQRLDRIKKAIDDESDVMLTESERNEKTELLAVGSLLLNPYNTTQTVIGMLKHEHGLSERQAFRRLGDAKFVFGNVFSPDRAMERMKAYQRAELAWQMAHDQEDPENMTRANEQMVKIIGADDPNDMIDPTKMEPSYYKAVLPPAQNKIVMAMLEGGAVDISARLAQAGLVIDVPHEEMDDEETAEKA